ncbi:FhaA domain-containing protein [Microbacterium sp. YY-01]|uniref:FhaA domain-containing protein n=1 Tax=Microbacterium sp. YY-01 TaxID=3421634 RepID=UPI003D16D2B0
MGILDSFEKGLERAVNSAFAKTFRSGIQPVEIASALRRAVDTNAAVVSRDRIIAPSAYTVRLSPEDAASMERLGSALNDEMHTLISRHVRDQGYSLTGRLAISLQADSDVATGTVEVDTSDTARGGGRVTWQAVLEENGRRHVITAARTIIGRGSEADVAISDPGSSRKHAEVLWDGERAMLRDLGSTNGTRMDGQRIREAALPSDTVFTIGRTELAFRIVPVSDRTRAASDGPHSSFGGMP